VRCFIALPLPSEARLALASVVEELARRWPRLSWARGEGYHVTLAFLGEIEEAGAECAAGALARLAEPAFSFRFAGLGGFPPAGPWRVLYAGLDDRPERGTDQAGEPGPMARLYRSVNEALFDCARERGLPILNPDWRAGSGSAGGGPSGSSGGGAGARGGGGGGGRVFSPHVTLARVAQRRRGKKDGYEAQLRDEKARPRPLDFVHMTPNIESRLAGLWTIDSCVLYKSDLKAGGAVYTELNRVALEHGRQTSSGADTRGT